jgi:hypothetical protein
MTFVIWFAWSNLFLLAVIASCASIYATAAQRKLFLLMMILALLLYLLAGLCSTRGFHAWIVAVHDVAHRGLCPPESFDFIRFRLLWLAPASLSALCVLLAFMRRPVLGRVLEYKIRNVEGDLMERLDDGSIRLLNVEWLLKMTQLEVGWTLLRRQDLEAKYPDEALWSTEDACRLLREGKVAALSYKWLGVKEPDPDRFQLEQVLAFFRERPRKQTALMWDFASVYQKNPALFDPAETPAAKPANERAAFIRDMHREVGDPMRKYLGGQAYEESRTPDETKSFRRGLGGMLASSRGARMPTSRDCHLCSRAHVRSHALFAVMSNMYASPRVLVLQQKKVPKALEDELHRVSEGGKLPADRLDLIPYAGRDVRSGWCTSETACAMLMTEGGGHAYELGVGKVPVTRGRLPSLGEMEALFMHESTRFVGKGDRKAVVDMYGALRKKIHEYDQQRVSSIVRYFDRVWTGQGAQRCLERFLWLSCYPTVAAVVSFRVFYDLVPRILLWELAIAVDVLILLLSRIVRAHLGVLFCCRPRNSLEYRFRCTLWSPPYYLAMAEQEKGEGPPVETAGEMLVVPSCFLPGAPPLKLQKPKSNFVRISSTRRVWPSASLKEEAGSSAAT